MHSETQKQALKDFGMLTVGTLLIALGVYFFKFPNNFSTGGVSGISIILAHYAPNLSAGAFVFIINQALLLLGFWRTLFIAVFAALGALAGGIGNKRDAVRVAINRSFPPKDKPLDIEQDTQDKTNKPE